MPSGNRSYLWDQSPKPGWDPQKAKPHRKQSQRLIPTQPIPFPPRPSRRCPCSILVWLMGCFCLFPWRYFYFERPKVQEKGPLSFLWALQVWQLVVGPGRARHLSPQSPRSEAPSGSQVWSSARRHFHLVFPVSSRICLSLTSFELLPNPSWAGGRARGGRGRTRSSFIPNFLLFQPFPSGSRGSFCPLLQPKAPDPFVPWTQTPPTPQGTALGTDFTFPALACPLRAQNSLEKELQTCLAGRGSIPFPTRIIIFSHLSLILKPFLSLPSYYF